MTTVEMHIFNTDLLSVKFQHRTRLFAYDHCLSTLTMTVTMHISFLFFFFLIIWLPSIVSDIGVNLLYYIISISSISCNIIIMLVSN